MFCGKGYGGKSTPLRCSPSFLPPAFQVVGEREQRHLGGEAAGRGADAQLPKPTERGTARLDADHEPADAELVGKGGKQ